MSQVFGYSIKAWWLAIGAPIVAFIAASVAGLILSLVLMSCCALCRRWMRGARGRDLIDFHHRFGGRR